MAAFPSDASRMPPPGAAQRARSAALLDRILSEIDAEGFLPFDRFMALALYAPGLGYYASDAEKLGSGGDFITAPELTPLFAEAVSAPLAYWLEAGLDSVLELGPGTGALAAALLPALERRGRLPRRYQLLELSATLRAKQEATIAARAPHLFERVQWLDELPEQIEAIVLGNEVLDAVPVALVRRGDEALEELGVVRASTGRALAWGSRRAQGPLECAAAALALPPQYTTEIHLQAQALIRSLGAALARGALLFLDYGFPAREYYHPQRAGGTLVCHYRHRMHPDPLAYVGLQDISAHLDFSALAAAGAEAGLQLAGYTTQAHFLIDCGILDALASIGASDTLAYAKAAGAVQKLLSPAEMGELVKAIAFTRRLDSGPIPGFRARDMRSRL